MRSLEIIKQFHGHTEKTNWIEIPAETIVGFRSAQGTGGTFQGVFYREGTEVKFTAASFYFFKDVEQPLFFRVETTGFLAPKTDAYVVVLPFGKLEF